MYKNDTEHNMKTHNSIEYIMLHVLPLLVAECKIQNIESIYGKLRLNRKFLTTFMIIILCIHLKLRISLCQTFGLHETRNMLASCGMQNIQSCQAPIVLHTSVILEKI